MFEENSPESQGEMEVSSEDTTLASSEGSLDQENKEEPESSQEESSDQTDELESEAKEEKNPRFRWYVMNVHTNSEEKAKATLIETAKNMNAEHFFGDVIVPKRKVEKILKDGRKKIVEKVQFPGYMYVEMDLCDDTIAVVTRSPKINGFVGGSKNPKPLPANEVLKITSPGAAAESFSKEKMGIQFKIGETVRIVDGSLASFEGTVSDVMPEKMRINVLVSIFGRESPVELSYNQVEKTS